jgi:hypothetical protein
MGRFPKGERAGSGVMQIMTTGGLSLQTEPVANFGQRFRLQFT